MHDHQKNSRTSQYRLLDNLPVDDNDGTHDGRGVLNGRLESKCGLLVCLTLALVGLSSLLISTSGHLAGRLKKQPEFVPPGERYFPRKSIPRC